MLKKLAILALGLVMCVGITVGCGGKKKSDSGAPDSPAKNTDNGSGEKK